MINTTIIGSGHYLPEKIVKNEDFLDSDFFESHGVRLQKDNADVIQKFQEITEIEERRYETKKLNSEIASIAAERAIEKAGLDKNALDYIIVAHNFGDLSLETKETDIMPSLSAKVKHNLGITNGKCKPYDMVFGCPGWIEGMIMGHQFIQAGIAKNVLVVGSETMSRVIDPHDRNAMIFADGAGAAIISKTESDKKTGVLAHSTQSDTQEELNYLINGPSLNPDYRGSKLKIRMTGRKVYEYGLKNVPKLIKEMIDEAGFSLLDVDKILIHQANAKMDYAIIDRLFKLYGEKSNHEKLTPMTIQQYGNSSVATIPTMYDKIMNSDLGEHELNSGNLVVFASIGAGMHINALLYKMP